MSPTIIEAEKAIADIKLRRNQVWPSAFSGKSTIVSAEPKWSSQLVRKDWGWDEADHPRNTAGEFASQAAYDASDAIEVGIGGNYEAGYARGAAHHALDDAKRGRHEQAARSHRDAVREHREAAKKIINRPFGYNYEDPKKAKEHEAAAILHDIAAELHSKPEEADKVKPKPRKPPRKPKPKKSWSEEDHPRGQPGNAGQFGSGFAGGNNPPSTSKPAHRAPSASSDGVNPEDKLAEQAREIVGGKIKKTTERAFTGEAVGTQIDGRLAGAIGEEILIQHLISLGFADARQTSTFMKTKKNNLPMDLIADHELIEVKTGQSNNPKGVWALKYDGKFTNEQQSKIDKMSPEKAKAYKKKINARKVKGIHDRKAAFIKARSEAAGIPVKGKMMTVIINHDTKTADIFEFSGIHDRIPFASDMAQKAYVRSVRYG